MSDEIQTDKRIQKTLSALQEAFFELVLSYSYDEIKVSDIIKKADVGRSTFYQHYKGKDDILTASMHFLLMTLANTIDSKKADQDELLWLIDHFWENRKFAPRIFSSNARRHIIGSLADMISLKLTEQIKHTSAAPKVPVNLVSHQIAEAQMTTVIDWMLGKGKCSVEDMADHVQRTSIALRDTYLKR